MDRERRRNDRDGVEVNVHRPHSLILVRETTILRSLPLLPSPPFYLSVFERPEGDAILISRCGFMNKISGLSDVGAARWWTVCRKPKVEKGCTVPRDHASQRCPWRVDSQPLEARVRVHRVSQKQLVEP